MLDSIDIINARSSDTSIYTTSIVNISVIGKRLLNIILSDISTLGTPEISKTWPQTTWKASKISSHFVCLRHPLFNKRICKKWCRYPTISIRLSGQKEILGLFDKSCLVKQANNEYNKNLILTELPTIQQVYIQLTLNLNQDFYIWPLSARILLLDLSFDNIIELMKPIHHMPEISTILYITYHPHYKENFEMTESV